MIVRSDMSVFQANYANSYALTATGKPGVKLDGATVQSIDPKNVRPLEPGDAEKMAAARALATSPPPSGAANWGYKAQLVQSGGQQAVDDFHANLIAYLKTTKLWSPVLDGQAPGSASDTTA